MTEKNHPEAILLTAALIDGWKKDLDRIEADINGLVAEKALVLRKIDAAEFLQSSLPVDEPTKEELPPEAPPQQPVRVENSSDDAGAEFALTSPPPGRGRKGTLWKDVILDAVNEATMGLTYAELRAAVLASSLGPKLDRSDKGYHNALSRLAAASQVVRDHGRVFTPEAFERFMAAVERGDASVSVPHAMAHSPMGDAILRIVGAYPAVHNGKGIIRELRKDPEFNAALTPHETGAYNIIARLVRRGQIIRRDDGLILPGRNFPKDYAPEAGNKTEAPNGNSAGAPEAGEVDASPNDNRPGLRLIG